MTLDFFVIGLYVAAMLALGAWAMRRTRTREDYLVAGRNLGPGFYLGSMAATILGGASTIGSVRLGYLHGISAFWLCALLGMGTLGVNWLLAKPLLKLKIYTVTQVLERRYSPATRQASAVIMLAYALTIGCTSVIAIGTIFQVFFGWSFALAALMSTASAGLLAASTTLSQDLLPLVWRGVQQSKNVQVNRLTTLLLGVAVLGISLAIQDIISALTVAYNLLVGGMLVPLFGAIFWPCASTRGAMTSMALGAATVIGFMVKDGILANTPIYYGLVVSLVGFVLVSLCSPASAADVQQAEA